MGRSHVLPRIQPDDNSCGPAALKHALEVLGKRHAVDTLIKYCKTNRNGTSTKNLVAAINRLGIPAMVVERASLHHMQSALKYSPNHPRAVLVSYLYWIEDDKPHPDTGHWAMVSRFSASKNRIVLLNSYTGKKISYIWSDFRRRWKDYDLVRKAVNIKGRTFRLVKKWQHQPMIIIARTEADLPNFQIATATMYPAKKMRKTKTSTASRRGKETVLRYTKRNQRGLSLPDGMTPSFHT